MVAKKQQKPLVDMDQFIEIVYNRSANWGKKYDLFPKGTKSPKEDYTDKAKQMAKVFDGHSFGGHDASVIELFEIMLGEKIPVSKSKKTSSVDFIPGIVVVVLSDPKGHGLPVGEPVLIKDAVGGCITKEMKSLGIPNNSTSAFRLPTLTEVEDILDSIKENDVESFSLMAFFMKG